MSKILKSIFSLQAVYVCEIWTWKFIVKTYIILSVRLLRLLKTPFTSGSETGTTRNTTLRRQWLGHMWPACVRRNFNVDYIKRSKQMSAGKHITVNTQNVNCPPLKKSFWSHPWAETYLGRANANLGSGMGNFEKHSYIWYLVVSGIFKVRETIAPSNTFWGQQV